MTLEEAKKFLLLHYKIRRKAWKKHILCTRIYEYEGHEYMTLQGFNKPQRITTSEIKSTDWEKF